MADENEMENSTFSLFKVLNLFRRIFKILHRIAEIPSHTKMFLKTKLLWLIVPFYMLAVVDELLYTEAYMNSVRIEEIPFAMTMHHSRNRSQSALRRPSEESRNIYALKRVDQHKGFLKIFNIPCKWMWKQNMWISLFSIIFVYSYIDIICFFAAKGKWPFIPPFMQTQVNAAARTFFNQNDSSIKQFCQKWIQIKECFRPIFCK